MTQKEILTEREAAAYLGLSPSTLRQGRFHGQRIHRIPPPPFIKAGRWVRYLKTDLDQWLRDQRVDLRGNAAQERPER